VLPRFYHCDKNIFYREDYIKKYFHVCYLLKMGFGLVIGFTDHLQVVTAIGSYTIADLSNLKSLHTELLSLFPLVSTILSLATDL
jgi:hypothetical protein